MQLDEITSIVQNWLKVGGIFTLEQLQSDVISEFAQEYFQNGELKISPNEIQPLKYDSSSVTVYGKGTQIPFTEMMLEVTFSLPENGEVSLSILATATEQWKLESCIPGLAGMILDDLQFNSSHPPTLKIEIASSVTEVPPLSFTGNIDLQHTCPEITSLLGLTQVSFQGELSLTNSGQTTDFFILEGPVSQGVDLLVAHDCTVNLTLGTTNYLNVAVPFLGFTTTIPYTSNGIENDISLAVEINNFQSSIRFIADIETPIQTSLDDLGKLCNKFDLAEVIPAQGIKLIDDISLNSLFFDLDLQSGKIELINIGIESLNSWAILKNSVLSHTSLSATNVNFKFSVFSPFEKPNAYVYGMGNLKIGQEGVLCVSSSYPNWEFQAYLEEGSTLYLTELMNEFFETDWGFPKLEINQLSIDCSADMYAFVLSSFDTWVLIENQFGINQVEIELEKAASSSITSGKVFGLVYLSTFQIAVFGEYNTGWQFSGNSEPGQQIPVGQLLEDLTQMFGVKPALPSWLQSITISDVALSFNTKTQDFSFGFSSTLFLAGISWDIQVNIALTKEDQGYTHQVTSTLTVGELTFELSDVGSSTSELLLAVCQGSYTVSISNLIQQIDPSVSGTLPDLSLSVTNPFLVIDRSDKTQGYVLGLDLGADLSLSALPIAGSYLSKAVQFKGLRMQYASLALLGEAASNVNQALSGASIDPIAFNAAGGISKGLGVTTQLQVLGLAQPLNFFDVAGPGTSSGQGTSDPGTATSQPATQKVGHAFGPVRLESMAMDFANGDLSFLIDASIALGPITLGFEGLSIGSPLDDFQPEASLKGLSLDYHTADLSIGGAFLNSQGDYEGSFTLSLSDLQLTVLGAYEQVSGHTSMFLYGVLLEPLGGPAFCFVEGLAATFGYNRNLIAPTVDQVSTYPLILAPMGQPPGAPQDLNTIQQNLGKYLPPQVGEYFVGVGMKFTSFKVIESFALLIGKFGNELEFDLVAESRYVAPNPLDPEPVAVVELDLIGTYRPAEGTLLIRGQLNPQSFVLSRACHLTGGFAVGAWAQGPHAGDFVYSYGGYGSHYQPPAHYPQGIPPLGFLWQVDDQASIKGGGYWTITPETIVAGGFLSATFSSSWVRASFDIDAYFLIDWSPLHYQASFQVTFSLSVHVHLLFVSKWVGFSLSDSLAIHGPPFGGTATIDLLVGTVHISFGHAPTPKPLLSGEEFAKSFLPTSSASGSDTPAIVSINIHQGLIKKVKDTKNNEVYFVDPKNLHLTTASFVPVTGFTLAKGSKPPSLTPFTIKPMGKFYDGKDHTSNHTVTITGTDDADQFSIVRSSPSAAPRSMWEDQGTGDNLLYFGTDITSKAAIPESITSSVPLSNLANEAYHGSAFSWQGPYDFSGTATAADQVMAQNMDPQVLQSLEQLFSFNTAETSSGFDGLKSKLVDLGDTEILVGQLNQTS